ncbi:MAG: SDR family NAD(P)-dependent oxidoreductase [Gammaproteobacteria bacterium]|jgi:NAD(P)-dependent dehydrogenase (short-subunit alcohol dehydrogenase family)|nr:SDR family NAD(P)-dependent oxidoreductase [Gammaproteobacteria bacterium]MBP6479426.1 SDR family NAD(P)-dependent oxidoreductase [Pseudomonadales bacterium]MBP7908709.1 SDR family NAD(P)-dependent oxidoreductase [Pseudomonadales bacterium]
MSESAPVALVTGASRGAGRGIALALGSQGCTVYVTGRSETRDDSPLPGTIYETAERVTAAGGTGIAVRVDHAVDHQVKTLFEQVQREQGRLDILVNNACAIHDDLTAPGPFWAKSLDIAGMLDVGLRSSYVASYYAAPLMVSRRHGLIVFTSASGSVHYVYGPVYGAHKAGMDKFAADMAVDLKDFDVAAVSIWMGALKAERLQRLIDSAPEKYAHLAGMTETPEFTGHVIWALYKDPALLEMSGRTVIGAEMGLKYGIRDEGGRQPVSCRDTHKVEPRVQYPYIIR